MRTLSFDTSSSQLHISLLESSHPVCEPVLIPQSGERQEMASVLLFEIDKALATVAWKKSDLELLVVGVGPGSFTGIRIAVITARTICQVLQLPLIGVPLLECYYYASGVSEPAAVLLSSTSNQLFYGLYAKVESDPAQSVIPPGCDKVDQVEALIKPARYVFGDEKVGGALPAVEVQPLPNLKNIGTIQAQLAHDRLSLIGHSPEPFSWKNVLPLYLRSPSVTIKKNYAAPDSTHGSR